MDGTLRLSTRNYLTCPLAFQNRVEVQPYFWEYEPMESTRDYQVNIPLTSTFDLVICISWKRLGGPLSVKHQRPDGGQWRSGTEFELVTAVESKKARGVPDIFIFKNDTKPTFEPTKRTCSEVFDRRAPECSEFESRSAVPQNAQ
jgi:hypothetical protein